MTQVMPQKAQTVNLRRDDCFMELECSNNDKLLVKNDGNIQYVIMQEKLTPLDKSNIKTINDLLKDIQSKLEVVYK